MAVCERLQPSGLLLQRQSGVEGSAVPRSEDRAASAATVTSLSCADGSAVLLAGGSVVLRAGGCALLGGNAVLRADGSSAVRLFHPRGGSAAAAYAPPLPELHGASGGLSPDIHVSREANQKATLTTSYSVASDRVVLHDVDFMFRGAIAPRCELWCGFAIPLWRHFAAARWFSRVYPWPCVLWVCYRLCLHPVPAWAERVDYSV